MKLELVTQKAKFEGSPPQRVLTPKRLGVLELEEGIGLDDVLEAMQQKTLAMQEIAPVVEEKKAEDKKEEKAEDKKPADKKEEKK